jgi:hypothetical protein
MRNCNGSARYHAASTTKPSVINDGAEYILKLRGLCVDRINIVHSASKGLDKLEAFRIAAIMISVCESLGLKGIYPFTREPYSHAYYRVLCTDILPTYRRADSAFYQVNLPILAKGLNASGLPAEDFTHRVEREVKTLIGYMIKGRCVFVSEKGYLGLGPKAAQKGDIISVLLGGDLVYILREKGLDAEFVGESYVHGLMDGEAIEGLDLNSAKFKIFNIF